ncbi:hypothetical protein P3T73_13745 [Kiritimatiellota bacterium B12222]|nr:hypothetical protein P3T73_13745 [Kiritimatiellota bacterium B12222]
MKINLRKTLVIAGTLLAASSIQAAILVSENYDSKATGTLANSSSGQDASLGSIGLTGDYDFNGDGAGQNLNVVAGGLAFSTYSSASGNSLQATSFGTKGTGGVAVAQLSLAADYTGTLYSSYLINFSSIASGSGAGYTRITSTSGATSGASRLSLRADAATNNVITPGVSYDNSSVVDGMNNLAIDTTYMMIGRYTNVGTALSGSTEGVATMFALTADQWDSFIAGGGDDAYLDGASVGTGSGQISAWAEDTATAGTFSFANGDFVQTVVAASSSGTETFRIDNMLYGTSLADVAVIPEPSTVLLGVIGALALLICRRR